MVGGLSGRPLKTKSLELVRYLAGCLPDGMLLVGAGGVFSGADVYEYLKAGAVLVQAYTGFIYEGPRFAMRCKCELLQLMDRDV